MQPRNEINLKLTNWLRSRQSSETMHSLLLLLFFNCTIICLAIVVRSVEATSHINTVWLPRDADEQHPYGVAELHAVSVVPEQQNKLNEEKIFNSQQTSNVIESNNSSHHFGADIDKAQKRTGEVSASIRNKLPKPIQISASASSLQPAIASVEAQPFKQRAQRRSGNQSSAVPFRFKLAHIEPAATNSTGFNLNYSGNENFVDNLWSSGSGSLNASKQIQNAQVQFDEEQPSRPRDDTNLVTVELAPVVPGQSQLLDESDQRRQDSNETTISSQAPARQQHEAHSIQLNDNNNEQIVYDERGHVERHNVSRANVPPDDNEIVHKQIDQVPDEETAARFSPINNRDQNSTSDNVVWQQGVQQQQKQPAPAIYYLPDGDKWNSQEFQRKPTDKEHDDDDGHGRQRQKFAATHAGQLSSNADGHLMSKSNRQSMINFSQPGIASDNWSERLFYQASPRSTVAPLDTTRTWPVFVQPNHHQFGSRYNNVAPAIVERPILVQHPSKRAHYYSAAPQMKQFKFESLRNKAYRPNFEPMSSQIFGPHFTIPINQASISLGQAASSSQNKRAFARNNQQSRRKSILGKLNNWTTSSNSRDNELAKASLEKSFYAGSRLSFDQDDRIKRRRPQNGWPHYDYAHQNRAYPTPPNTAYGYVHSPSVAPASSALQHMNYGGAFGSPSRLLHHNYIAQQATRPVRLNTIQHAQSQQPAASFIPVVAVQVSRTSPAPILPQLEPEQATMGDDNSNEIDQYLETKTGQRNRLKANSRQNVGQMAQWDNMAVGNGQTGSATSNSMRHQLHTSMNGAVGPRNHLGHETTVTKSAVFGYLPHNADGPLLHAMNVLQQMPQTATINADSQSAPHSSIVDAALSSLAMPQHQQLTGNHKQFYVNQMERSNNHDATTSTHYNDQQAALIAAAAALPQSTSSQLDEQPNLSLQLQANNFFTNDIAHPFASGPSVLDVRNQHQRTNQLFAAGTDHRHHYHHIASHLGASEKGASGHVRPIEVIYPNAEHYVQQQQQLLNNLFADQQQAHQQRHTKPQADFQQQIYAASELNPLLQHNNVPPAFVLSGPVAGMVPLSDNGQTTTTTDSDQQMSTEASVTTTMAGDNQSETSETSAIDNMNSSPSKGKKRSSDFFANAGQLLLSALPLLLAPTLGLMFASSPNRATDAQIARLHPPSPAPFAPNFSADATNWLQNHADGGQLAPAHASSSVYNNPNNEGMVSNASPSPHVFTPMPMTAMNGGDYPITSASGSEQSVIEYSAMNQSRLHEQQHKNNNKTIKQNLIPTSSANRGVTLPALTGLKTVHTPLSSNKHNGRVSLMSSKSSTSSTTPKPPLKTIILSTFEPHSNVLSNVSSEFLSDDAKRQLAQGHDLVLELNGNNSTGQLKHYSLSDSGTNQSLLTPSVLILSAEPYETLSEEASDKTTANNKTTLNQASRQAAKFGSEQGNGNKSATAVHYDIGYEGADFDAHFAALGGGGGGGRRRVSEQESANRHKVHEHALTFDNNDKNRYKYSELSPQSANVVVSSDDAAQKGQMVASSELFGLGRKPDKNDSTANERLFPVSTWPSLRRRTVSLVTSHGNRTLYGAASYNNNNSSNSKQANGSQQIRHPSSASVAQSITAHAATNVLSGAGQIKQDTESQLLDSFLLERAPGLARQSGAQERAGLILGDNNGQQQTTAANERARSVRSNRLIKRFKRQIGPDLEQAAIGKRPQEQQKKRKRRRKRVVLRREFKIGPSQDRQTGVQQVASANTSNTTGNMNNTDELNRDASRHKSAIVTAMITQLGPLTNQADGVDSLADNSTLYSSDTGAQSNESNSQELSDRARLRAELLHRKMILDRLATHSNELIEENDKRSSLVGRGRLKASNQPESVDGHYLAREHLVRQHELPEDTQRSLANIGNLLLDDTLQLHDPSKRPRSANMASLKVKLSQESGEFGRFNESHPLATERYTSYSSRPTLAPDDWGSSMHHMRPLSNESHHHNDVVDYGMPPPGYEIPNRSRNYHQELNETDNFKQFGERGMQHESTLSRYNQFIHNRTSNNPRHVDAGQQAPPSGNRPETLESRYSAPYNPDSSSGNYYGNRRDHSPSIYQSHQAKDYNTREQYRPGDSYTDHQQQHNRSAYEGRQYTSDGYAPVHNYGHREPALGPNQLPPPLSSHAYDPQLNSYGISADSRALTGTQSQHYASSNSLHSASHPHQETSDSFPDPAKSVNNYLKRVQFSDSDRDKLMASYLTCDGLLNDNDHCLERLSCEFSDPYNIEKANKLDRAVSSILLGHILINTYIPNSFKLRLKSASLYGYTQSGKCSKYSCSKLNHNPKN